MVIGSSGCEYAKSMQTGRLVSYGPFNFFKTSSPKGNQTPVSGVRGRKLLTIISLVEPRVFH